MEVEDKEYYCRECSEDYAFFDWCDWSALCRWCCEEGCCNGNRL